MFKKILKFLLYLLIALLIAAMVIIGFVFLKLPIEDAFVTIGIIFAAIIGVILIRKLYVRYRARSQVKRVIQQGKPAEEDLGMSPAQLINELRKGWRTALKGIKKSNLRSHGDPLYVLPWYMVIGRPRSGKSSALKNAKLLLPDINLPKQGPGSTLNVDWWLYEQAIVIDTAGRYSVPDNEERDKKEWGTLLGMLSRHKQKEPINGVVLVVAADRLLENSEDELMDEGRQVRASINELMERLEVKVPVYLMVTKCDLIEGFNDWTDYLPDEAALQAMGHLYESDSIIINENIDLIFDKLLDRIKELRILMLDRSQDHSDSLLTFPSKIEALRNGLKIFTQTALKENPYQDTPKFRGLFFTSSQQKIRENGENEERGLFLHEFFTNVLPADRDLLDSLPNALRLRRAIRAYGLSIGGAVTLVALAFITILFRNDISELNSIYESYPKVQTVQADINNQLYELYSLRSLILDIEDAQKEWLIPWYGPTSKSTHLVELKKRYVNAMKEQVLIKFDSSISKRIVDLKGFGTSSFAGGLIRRINLLKTQIGSDKDTDTQALLDKKPSIQSDYLTVMNPNISRDTAEVFDDLYISYLQWQNSKTALLEEKSILQTGFIELIERNHGDYRWIIDWANQQDNLPVLLGSFWAGSIKLDSPPIVQSAYTLEGRAFIMRFLNELSEAGSEENSKIASIKTDFEILYKRQYLQEWRNFAFRFDEGKLKLRGRKEWIMAIDSLPSRDNPYFKLLSRLVVELEPFNISNEFEGMDMFELFVEMEEFTGAAKQAKGSNKATTKFGLKILGKLGPVGKALAKSGKASLKENKKLDKDKSKTAQGPDLDDAMEDSSKTLVAYKKALTDIAFASESKNLSYSAINSIFTNATGDGAATEARKAISDFQRLSGKPRPSTQMFWNLYQGPLGLVYDYMEQETNCKLQNDWETEVLAQIEGVSQNKMGGMLIGEGGLVWSYVDSTASAFLSKRARSGYLPTNVDKRRVRWTADFLNFLNQADQGRYIVDNEFTVRIDTLPTGVNIGAAMSPYATFLDLHCADGVQTLANYNYADGHSFKWSLENCGDISLRIEIGHVSLSKHYNGVKGFSKFLADFRDGRRVFTSEEFPNQASQLRNESVTAIDVSYEIQGQAPVVQILKSVPLAPPQQIAQCW
jgi:type VI secretion system protein ImpL